MFITYNLGPNLSKNLKVCEKKNFFLHCLVKEREKILLIHAFLWENGICQNWNLSELESVRIGICQNPFLPIFEEIGICQNWNLSELEFVRIGIRQNWNLSESEFVRILKCAKLRAEHIFFFKTSDDTSHLA